MFVLGYELSSHLTCVTSLTDKRIEKMLRFQIIYKDTTIIQEKFGIYKIRVE